MQILYKPILNIHLWHDYALGQPEMPYKLATNYNISDIFVLRPTKTCEKTLKNLRWVARSHSQGITLFADVKVAAPGDPNSDYRTTIAVSRPVRLTFWLEVKDPTFANFTSLPLTPANRQIYYFSNRFGTVQTYEVVSDGMGEAVDVLFLSQPLPTYDASAEYFLGQLVLDGEDTLEALTYQPTAAGAEDTDAWIRLPLSHYVSAQDQLPRQGLTRSQTIPTANPGDRFTFSLQDLNEQRSLTQTVTVPTDHPPSEPFTVNLNFGGQAPGRYQLILNDTLSEGPWVVFDPLAAPRAFGLVEIAVIPDSTDPFALLRLDGSDTMMQPRDYIVRFKNRVTRWRYRTQTPHGFDSTAPPDGFVVIDEQTYVTAAPRPLLRQFSSPIPNNGQRNLPFPSSAQIKTDDDRPVTQVFSDIYL